MQTLSNYGNNYNALQLVFPLEIGLKINLDDELVSFLKAIEGVNLRKYLKRRSSRGRKGFDKVMLLKIILFARMIVLVILEVLLLYVLMIFVFYIFLMKNALVTWLSNVCLQII